MDSREEEFETCSGNLTSVLEKQEILYPNFMFLQIKIGIGTLMLAQCY